MIRRAERGLLPGNVPYGWRKVFDADGKPHFEIDEQAATAVRKAFEWFLAGEGKEAIATCGRSTDFKFPLRSERKKRAKIAHFLRES